MRDAYIWDHGGCDAFKGCGHNETTEILRNMDKSDFVSQKLSPSVVPYFCSRLLSHVISHLEKKSPSFGELQAEYDEFLILLGVSLGFSIIFASLHS